MDASKAEVHAAGIRLVEQVEAFDNDPEAQKRFLIEQTGSAEPNRAQRRAAEKRLRRQRRNQGRAG